MKRRKIGRKTAKARVKAARRNAPKGARVRAAAAKDTDAAQIQREREEALQQQAATAEILKLISSSPADTQPVFDAIVRSGLKLFPGAAMFIALPDGDKLRAAAFAATDAVRAKMWARQWPIPLTREYMHSLAFLDRKTVDIPDAREAPPELATGAKNFLPTGYRALTIMPMMRGRTAIGTLSVVRLAPGKLSAKQNAALKTYASQAVIAIENTRLLNELRQRTDDLSESLEQQTATSAVLKVISSTPGELEPVFQAILENATRICQAKFGVLYRSEEDAVRCVAMHNAPKAFAEERRRNPLIRPAPATVFGRALAAKRPAQIADIRDEIQSHGVPSGYTGTQLATLAGARTVLAVPMLKDAEVVGGILIFRQQVRPFTDKQTELLTNFAAQAVIAIENTRLLSELRESLDQQTATAEVLKVISASPGELEPVFNAILANATNICGAKFGTLYLHKGDAFFAAAFHNAPPAFVDARKDKAIHPNPESTLGRTARTGQVAQILDATEREAYRQGDPFVVAGADLGGYRTIVSVPMLKDDELVGIISIYRQEVLAFNDKQIELVKNFAAQAVIAIENARLLNELRESLQQQTATSDVLQVISSSLGSLEPVFQAILQNATQICQAGFGTLNFFEDGTFRSVALHNPPPEFKTRLGEIIHPHPHSGLAHVARTKQIAHIEDIKTQKPYLDGDPAVVKLADGAGARTLLIVPMLKEGDLVGCISIYRQEVRPFADKQIELVQNFAAQAVIAIENARLLNELRERTDDLSESLDQQTATADVLKVISASPGDMKPVFAAMLTNALRLCQAKFGHLLLYDGERFHATHLHDVPSAYREYWEKHGPIRPAPNTGLGRIVHDKQMFHIPDLKADAAYVAREPLRVVTVEQAGARSFVGVPMLKEDKLVGAIVIYRQEVRPFTERQIELLQNFAAQAVIAIENTRLLNELRQRTDDLTEALEQQTATSEILEVISNSPTDTQPVFDAIVRSGLNLFPDAVVGISLPDRDLIKLAAMDGADAAGVEALRGRFPMPLSHEFITGTAILERREIDLADAREPPNELTVGAKNLLAGGYHAMTVMPMMRGEETIGALNVVRRNPGPLSDKQRGLLRTFASQAVIAIENTRLFSELSESLQQQTATADVLTVISSSPGTLDPVFSTMLAKATELCEASYSTLWLHEGDGFRTAAIHGDLPPAWIEQWRSGAIYRPGPDRPIARATEERRPIQVADMRADPSYLQGDPLPVAGVEIAGIRTLLIVPMFKESETVGVIAIYRKEVLPFTEKQIELVQNFAAQAVIAVENTRLLNELRESLQQQTATADVLKVISRSTFDLGTVLQTLVESAVRLCDADKTNITRQKDGVFFRAEAYGFSAEFMDYVRDIPIRPDRGSAFGRALLERRAVHIPDVKADPEYTLVEGQKLGDFRTVLAVPMLREDVVVGVLTLTRSDVRPFTEKQIELASTFADQAAIAIENVRLFDEVQGRTRELADSLEDLRTAQDRLVQTQKLASLGQLTAGIAHEIKNPLNFVNNFSAISTELIDELQDALKGIPLDGKRRAEVDELTTTLRSNLEKVVQHGKRADTIVKNMLLHSREGSGEHRIVDVNALVEESLNLAYHGARAEKQGFNITLERSFDAGAGTADLFPQEITRVLLNLISNGFYAASKRKVGSTDDDYVPTLRAATKSLGDSVEIRIRDNGTGIPPDVAEKIFNPFFTTKPAGEGTGLGLSLSHDIVVKQHGGSIEVDTRPGEFTEFRVILPRAGAALAKAE